MSPLRVVFMGSPEFALPSLESILNAGHNVVGVYTQPPKEKGRGKQKQMTKVGQFALSQGLEVRTPPVLKNKQAIDKLISLKPDIIVVVAYGKILPSKLLYTPKFGCINAHASLLPRWRGAAPIQRAIMAGDTKTGISIMQMKEGLDTGPIYSSKEIPISDLNTSGEMHEKLSILSGKMIKNIINALCKGQVKPKAQLTNGITYAHKIEKFEAQIDWQKTAKQISCQIRGLNPSPGAWFYSRGDRIKVLQAKVSDNLASEKIGKIWCNSNGELLVTCGTNTVISLQKLQYSGKKPLEIKEFLRGRQFPLDTILPCPDIN